MPSREPFRSVMRLRLRRSGSQRCLGKAPPRLRVALAGGVAVSLCSTAALLPGCRQPNALPRTLQPPRPAAHILTLQPVSNEERRGYAGSAACSPCHPKEASQIQSRHARTLTRVRGPEHLARFRLPSNKRASNGQMFRARVEGASGVVEAVHGRRLSTVAADFALGSGHRGMTYLGRDAGGALELRISYYHAARGWDFSPQQPVGASTDLPVGRRVDGAEEADCFVCHSTAVVREGTDIQPDRSIMGVGCEACHGPGGAHIRARRQGRPDETMAHLTGLNKRVTLELCGQCHKSPVGDDLGHPIVSSQLARFQTLALSLSACFQKADLGCVSCHDPHRDTSTDIVAFSNGVCGRCHAPATPKQVACRVAPQGNCVRCHMPAQRLDMPTRPSYTNHWIGLWPEGGGTARAPSPPAPRPTTGER